MASNRTVIAAQPLLIHADNAPHVGDESFRESGGLAVPKQSIFFRD